MRWRCARTALQVLLITAMAGHTFAGEPETVSPAQLHELVKRLEQAEEKLQRADRRLESANERIDSLEKQLREGSSSQPREFVQSPRPSEPSKSLQTTEPIHPELSDPFLMTAAEQPELLVPRLEELESRWEKHDADYKKLHDAVRKSVQQGTSGATIKLFGRIHGDYWAFPGDDAGIEAFEGDDPQDRFVWRRVRIGVKGRIQDNMEYKIELEFADPNDAEYRDLYIGWTDLPVLQTLRLGNQKRPYGLDHLNSSRYNVFLERPFIIEAFNQDARRLGLVSYGVSDDLAWNWRYGVYNMELTQNDAGHVNDHYQLEFASRLANTWWYDECSHGRGYGHWAISGTIAHPDGSDGGSTETRFRTRPEARTDARWLNTGTIAETDTYELLGLEGVLNVGALQVVGEFQNVWLQRDPDLRDLYFWGGYGYVSYFLTGEHIPWDRATGTLGRVIPFENFFLVDRCCGGTGHGWGAWQLALRYSYADFSDEETLGGIGESVTAGLNWHWNPNARLQFNYIHGTIDNHAPVDGETSGNYNIVGARFMIDY